MSAVIRSTTRNEAHPYVHKLRLEAREGAMVDIRPTAPLVQSGPRIIAKIIGVSFAAAALLMLLIDQIAS